MGAGSPVGGPHYLLCGHHLQHCVERDGQHLDLALLPSVRQVSAGPDSLQGPPPHRLRSELGLS